MPKNGNKLLNVNSVKLKNGSMRVLPIISMKKILFIIALCGCFILNSCYYDKEEELYGAGGCDTTQVTYSVTINTIINNNACLTVS